MVRIDNAIFLIYVYEHGVYLSSEAQKKAEVAAIEYEQRIKEKESMKKMSSIEGIEVT